MTRFDILWMFGAATTGRSTVEPCWIEKQDKEEPRFARPRFEMVVGVSLCFVGRCENRK